MSKLRVDEIGNTNASLSLVGSTKLNLTSASSKGNGFVLPNKSTSNYSSELSGSLAVDAPNKSLIISDGVSKNNSVNVYATPRFTNGLVEQGLEVYYDVGRSWDKQTNTLLDLSGNNRTISLSGNAKYYPYDPGVSSLKRGDSILFDGVAGTWAQTQQRFTFNPLSFSVTFYNYSTIIKENSIGGAASGYQGLLGFVSEVGGTYGYGVTLGGWTSGAVNESVEIWSLDIGGFTYLATEIPIGYNNFCFNWNIHEGRYDMWINGWKVPVYPGSDGHCKQFTRRNAFLRLGGTDYPGYVFYGEIFSYWMYGRPLTDIEVINNLNIEKKFIMNRRSNRGYNNPNASGGLERLRG